MQRTDTKSKPLDNILLSTAKSTYEYFEMSPQHFAFAATTLGTGLLAGSQYQLENYVSENNILSSAMLLGVSSLFDYITNGVIENKSRLRYSNLPATVKISHALLSSSFLGVSVFGGYVAYHTQNMQLAISCVAITAITAGRYAMRAHINESLDR